MIALLLAAAVAVPNVPDPRLTPGDVLTTDARVVCAPGYARTVRHVTEATKRAVMRAYGIDPDHHAPLEVDHSISLELGGSNDPKNLAPQRYEPRPGAHEKDLLENFLHGEVCAGRMKLTDAQHQIATDWLSAWKAMPKKGAAFRRAVKKR